MAERDGLHRGRASGAEKDQPSPSDLSHGWGGRCSCVSALGGDQCGALAQRGWDPKLARPSSKKQNQLDQPPGLSLFITSACRSAPASPSHRVYFQHPCPREIGLLGKANTPAGCDLERVHLGSFGWGRREGSEAWHPSSLLLIFGKGLAKQSRALGFR